MGKGAKFAAGALLIAVLIGGAAWWLLRGRGENVDAPADAPTAPVASAADADVPAIDAAAPRPLGDTGPNSTLVAPADASTSQPGDAITFTGRVLDAAHRPVPGAEVIHLPSDPWREAAALSGKAVKWRTPWERFSHATTDAEGRFTLPTRELAPLGGAIVDSTSANTSSSGSGAGRLPRLLVRHPDFAPSLFTAWAWSRGSGELGDLIVEPGGAVAARLVDSSGQPVAGCAVTLSRSDDPDPHPAEWDALYELPRTTSGPDGRFLLDGLWPATLTLDLTAAGFVPQRRHVTLRAGDTVDLGDVVLDRGGAIDGWVLRATGEPIDGAQLVLRPDGIMPLKDGPDTSAIDAAMVIFFGGSGYELRATTAADGSFHVQGVGSDRNQTWRLTASADGFEPATQKALRPGAEPVHFALQPAARLVLHVVDPQSRAPVADAHVDAHRIAQFQGRERWPLAMTVTAQGDGWLLVGAGVERNEVVVSAPGRATSGFVLPGVEAGASAEQTVELPREALLAGRVVDDTGAPLPRARVRCVRPDDKGVPLDALSAIADAQGLFAFHAVCEGDWSLTASAAGCIPADAVRRTLAREQRVEDVELPLARGGRIAGQLLGRDLSGVTGREVRAAPVADAAAGDGAASGAAFAYSAGDAGGAPAPAADSKPHVTAYKGLVDDRDAYLVDGLPAGDYRVTCFPGAEGVAHVTAGEQTQLDLLLHERPRVRGRVTAAGRPVADAEVVVSCDVPPNRAWGDDRTVRTDASGEFSVTLDGVGGDYGGEVYARWKGARTRAVLIDPKWDHEDVVDLAFGGGALVGEIVDEAGAPVQAQVQFAAGARDGFGPSDRVSASVDSDAQGKFRLEFLPASRGTFTVYDSHFVGVTLKDTEVKEGETTTLPRIVLRAGGALEVHVGGEADANDWTKRFRITVRSLAEAGWERTSDVRWGATSTMSGIPLGNVEIQVSRPGSGRTYELVRTVPAVIERDQTLHFEQPVGP